MSESVHKAVELIRTSTEPCEKVIKVTVERGAETPRDLRISEIVEQDVQLKETSVIRQLLLALMP